MKEFILDCLENLESLTGIRQLFYLRQREDWEKQIGIIIDGILYACKRHDYIPEENQKQIIRKMMMDDQDYDSLNGRTINKWLEANKGKWYFSTPKISEEELTGKILTPEESEKYIQEWKEAISKIGDLPKVNGSAILRKEKGIKGSVLSEMPELARRSFTVGQVCPRCNGDAVIPTGDELIGDELIKCLTCNGTGEVNRKEVWAKDEEEAKAKYNA